MSNKVIIATDSTCDLGKELIEKYDIKVLPLHVNFGTKSYQDTVDITAGQMFEKIKETGDLPTTSAASPGEMMQFFKQFLDQGYDIVYTGISSQMSVTFNIANLAKKELGADNIYLVDSGNLSTGIGLLLLKAAYFRDQGFSASEIAKKVEDIVPRVKVQFVIDTLDNLYKGGRCNSVSYVFSKVLRVKPMIVVREKTMQVGAKFVGSITKAQRGMTNLFLKDFENIDKQFVFITHSFAPEGVTYIKSLIKDVSSQIENLYVSEAGCVIGCHCGENCIGILYIMKDEIVKKEENIVE